MGEFKVFTPLGIKVNQKEYLTAIKDPWAAKEFRRIETLNDIYTACKYNVENNKKNYKMENYGWRLYDWLPRYISYIDPNDRIGLLISKNNIEGQVTEKDLIETIKGTYDRGRGIEVVNPEKLANLGETPVRINALILDRFYPRHTFAVEKKENKLHIYNLNFIDLKEIEKAGEQWYGLFKDRTLEEMSIYEIVRVASTESSHEKYSQYVVSYESHKGRPREVQDDGFSMTFNVGDSPSFFRDTISTIGFWYSPGGVNSLFYTAVLKDGKEIHAKSSLDFMIKLRETMAGMGKSTYVQ